MRTIHLVSHTHWDREWYRPFQEFRLRLVHLVDHVIDLLEHDPLFEHFMLDGQTIILDDYLRMRPEAQPALERLVRSGRLVIGPWHVLPDMFLVGPEAHIRNLLEGDRQARRFGPKMMIGYMPDSFGHIGQMPQILQGFDIEYACLWRGLDEQPDEFSWQAPDGSHVMMLYLRDSYSNGAALNASVPERFVEQVRVSADSLAAHSAVDAVLLMYGTDHMEPPRETSRAIEFANSHLQDHCIVHSTLPDYAAAVRSQLERSKTGIPTVRSELRSSRRSHLLPGVLSTRMWIKQRNHACETLLEKWAEPFSTFATLAVAASDSPARLNRPAGIVREAWRMLMECHPHDSICGCSIDQVHHEMRPRFDQVEQVGEEIVKQSLEALAGQVYTAALGTSPALQSAVVVFNPCSAPRTDVVTSQIFLPPGLLDLDIVDEAGNVVPHQSASGQSTDFINVRVPREQLGGLLAMVHEGRAGNLSIRDLHFQREGHTLRVDAIFAENGSPDLAVWEAGLQAFKGYLSDDTIKDFHIQARSPDAATVTFTARDVPGLGWRTFVVRAKETSSRAITVTPLMRVLAPLAGFRWAQKLAARRTQPHEQRPYSISNEHFTVTLDETDGTLSVLDNASGTVWAGLNRFVDGGDCGDTYNFCPPPEDRLCSAARVVGVSIMRGPVQHKMTARLVLRVPRTLAADRKSRSGELIDMPITTVIALTSGVPRVDIQTRVENHAEDHRLRVHFPAPFAVSRASHDGHFEVVERTLGVPPFDESWIEEPRPEVPQRAFTSIAGGHARLTVANRGLPEVEVLRRGEGTEIALTLLRCVGWLSRDDFRTRRGHAGPFLATPGAQMPGTWDFEYSIILALDAASSQREAWAYQSALRASPTGLHGGALARAGAFVMVDDPRFMVTAVKESDDGRGWLVRGCNMSDEELRVTLTPWRKFKHAGRTNLAEHPKGDAASASDGSVKFTARPHEVLTHLFSD